MIFKNSKYIVHSGTYKIGGVDVTIEKDFMFQITGLVYLGREISGLCINGKDDPTLTLTEFNNLKKTEVL